MKLKTNHQKGEIDIEITHPDRVVYPEDNITKLDLAEYYQNIHQWILPYVIDRPLAIFRCPSGINGACFFQKHLADNKRIKHVFEGDNYLYIEDLSGLMQFVQMGVLEFHPWGTTVDKIDKPDMITFDLDPGEGSTWGKVIDAAFLIKEELEKKGLDSFVKTTGGKGLHVVVPIQRRYDWECIAHFAKTFSQYIVSKYPADYVHVMSKYKRNKKIFIDYLRNQRGASAVAAYSTRARPMATVSTPLAWEELKPSLKATDFTIQTVQTRLELIKSDPWQDFSSLKQKLPK